MENLIGGEAGGIHSRANLLIEPVRIFTNNDKDKTDILVEIFVPQAKFPDFISLAREIMRNTGRQSSQCNDPRNLTG